MGETHSFGVMRLLFLKNLTRNSHSLAFTKKFSLHPNHFSFNFRKFSTMENSNSSVEESLNGMSVKELKSLLASRNVDHSGTVEKSELIQLLKKALTEVSLLLQ